MGFTIVDGKDDHEQEDAVRRGVADGLARLLGVPKHPDSVQAILDTQARADEGTISPGIPAAVALPRTGR